MCLMIAFIIYVLVVLFLSTLIFPMPINDSEIVRYRTVPWGTMSLIIINTIIFVLWIAPDLYNEGMVIDPTAGYIVKITTYGFKEPDLHDGTGIGAFASLSSMFMHADFWHLFSNMLYLWTFGRRVEDGCGSWRFLLFYLIAGLLAVQGNLWMNPEVQVRPGIGASGAIAGVMGAYLLLYPGSRVLCLWGAGIFLRLPIATIRKLTNPDLPVWRWTVSLPAWLLLIGFVIQNTLPSLETIQGDTDLAGVNYLAHLAGFFAGFTVFLFVRKDLLLRYLSGRAL